jgi:hypothetical protein
LLCNQLSALKGSETDLLHIGLLHIRLLHIGLLYIGLLHIGILHIGLLRIGLLHIGLLHIGLLHIGLLHIGFLLKGSEGGQNIGFLTDRVFDCQVIDISGFCLVGFLISGF